MVLNPPAFIIARMDSENILAALDKFFLDFIGLVLPGAVLILGFWEIFNKPVFFGLSSIIPSDLGGWIVFISVCYAAGHLIGSVAETIYIPLIVYPISTAIIRIRKRLNDKFQPSYFMPEPMLAELSMDQPSFAQAYKYLYGESLVDNKKTNRLFRDIRSAIMSLIRPSDRSTVVRFMFIALFNLGVSTSIVILICTWVVISLLQRFFPGQSISPIPLNVYFAVVLLVSSIFFIERYFRYFARSLRTPLSMFASVPFIEKAGKSGEKE